MNKKFFTLAAGLLLTSAFSANADGENSLAKSKVGQYVEIKVGRDIALQIADDNTLETGEITTPKTAKALNAAFAQQWKIASLKYDTNSGTPIYQFVNKGTGQYLAINLKTDNKGASTGVAKINAAGNKDWCVDADGHLYVFQNDSTYTLDSDLKLVAAKGNAVPSTAKAFTIERNETEIGLNAAVLNALMGKAGKLYFNDANVTDGETNVVADNVWKAYDEGTGTPKGMFIARFSKDSVTSDSKNPWLLMVDTAYYTGSTAHHKLMIDTLALSHSDAELLKDNKYIFDAKNYNAEKPLEFAHQREAAIWNANYVLGNDSISLSVLNVPTMEAQNSVLTDGTNKYGEADDAKTSIVTIGGGKGSTSLPTFIGKNNETYKKAQGDYTKISDKAKNTDVKIALVQVESALSAWVTAVAGKDFAEGDYNSLQLKNQKFANDGTLGNDKGEDYKFQDFLNAVKDKLNKVTDKTTDEYKAEKAYYDALAGLLSLQRTQSYDKGKYYHVEYAAATNVVLAESGDGSTYSKDVLVLAQLSNTKVLTVGTNNATTPAPLIQAVSTKGGDAKIDGNGKVYFMQLASEPESKLRALSLKGKYVVADPATAEMFDLADEVDAANVYAQWGFIEGATGYYQIVNRATGDAASLPINKTTKAGVYEIDGEEYRLIEVDLSNADIREEKGVKYDYTGYYYGGPADGVSQSFQITPASALLSNVAVQFNKDSVLVLGKAENAPVWYLEAGDAEVWGAEIPGLPQLKRVSGYKIYTKDANDAKYYVYPTEKAPKVYAITKSDSENASKASEFKFQTQAANAYLFVDKTNKATINLNLNVPTIEVSAANSERNDYFSFTKSEYSDYRTLVAEDGLLGNAKIYMENEPNRYLYENTKNIVANNGNNIAKDSLNFLGIYNAMASVQNAALYIDTAYVDRKDNYRPQYMLAVGVTEVAATEGHACTEAGKHFDANGKETTADKCVHATPGTEGYKTGRYLVTLQDSVATGFTKHPALYDGNFRLAFVEAKHIKDTLEIANSKFTADEHVKDSIFVGKDLQKATFALKIVDQATKSFVMETVKGTYVRILNGVPVLTTKIEDAAVFNIAATTEEATANEAIEAAGVQVIGGKGAVTVQGAAGKVITVANILGQTIANQVAASDNVTIAAPAGVVVVAVEGEATKVVVK